MKQIAIFILALAALLLVVTISEAKHETATPAVLYISDNEQIKLARSAAPPSISDNATIIIVNWDGKYKEVITGSNGFTCYSDLDKIDVPVPSCMDKAALLWWNDFTSGKPGPTNKVPGFAYMAQGALRWEKNGKIYMDWHEPGTTRVKEPAHWVIFWPFNAKSAIFQTYPGKFGSYIMYDGTPWSHLMIYQDPLLMNK